MNPYNHRKEAFCQLKKAFDDNPKLTVVSFKKGKPSSSIFRDLPDSEKTVSVPLYSSGISAGMARPVDGYIERYLDLNHHFIQRPGSTFLVRVEGHSMIGAGIENGDILIVDRSLKPTHGAIIVALVDNEFTVKRLRLSDNRVTLVPENPDFRPLEITEHMDFVVWGVVLHSIKTF